MKLLLVAYEFPPVTAAQSLRWYYLANELAKRGHHIDVVTGRPADIWGSDLPLHDHVSVTRVFSGPFIGSISAMIGRTRRARPEAPAGAPVSGVKVYRQLRRWLDGLLFPDLRSEWYPFALRKLRQLVKHRRYDALITSHEPGVDLQLGLTIKRAFHLPWVADMGDILALAARSKRRQQKELRLEQCVCQNADLLTVTNENAAELMQERHQIANTRIRVVTQGFTLAASDQSTEHGVERDSMCRLVYTGSLYKSIRNPDIFLDAVAKLAGIKMTVAGYAELDMLARQRADSNLEYVPGLSHEAALALQRRADILIHFGNTNPYQTPGKFFEYLGACRPILHISMNPLGDEAATILTRCRRGVVVENRAGEITKALEQLLAAWRERRLDTSFDLSMDTVRRYSWQAQAEAFDEGLRCFVNSSDAPSPT